MRMEISQYLKQNQISQADFAAMIGVTQGRVSQIINGSSVPPDLAVKIETQTGGDVPRETHCPRFADWATSEPPIPTPHPDPERRKVGA